VKKSKHRKIVLRSIEEATTRAFTEAGLLEGSRRAEEQRQRLEQQQSDDIALIEAGMIPLRVFSVGMVPGSDQMETIFDNGSPAETRVSFTVRGADPALVAALRAISTRDR